MNISNLEAFVETENRMRAIFKQRPLSLLNAEDRQRIADDIDCRLSPENLTCDGELRGSQVQKKYAYLTRCAQELLSIDSAVKFYEYE
jgi:hypothetical protein